MKPVRAAAYAAVLAAATLGLAPGCSGVLGLAPGTLSDGGLGTPCYVQSGGSQTTCSSGFRCVGDVCRTACSGDSDCLAGQRCVTRDSFNGVPGYGCVPLDGLPCNRSGGGAGCAPTQVCDPNGQCRTSCNAGGSFGGSSGGFGGSGGGFGGSSSGFTGNGGSPGCGADQMCLSMGGPWACYGPHDNVGISGTDGGDDGGAEATVGDDVTTGPSCVGSPKYTSCAECGQLSSCSQCDGCVSQGGSGSCVGTPSFGSCANCGSAYCSTCLGCTPTTGTSTCVGTPPPCSTYSGNAVYASACASLLGCSWVSSTYTCVGSAYPCSYSSTSTACASRSGCSWSSGSSTCTGALTPCIALDLTNCTTQSGCSWSGSRATCTGVLTQCSQLSSSQCSLQPGCSLPGDDASTDASDASCAIGSVSSDGAVLCNCLTTTSAPVMMQVVSGTPPPGMGGTILDGTYVLTSATLFTGPGGVTTVGPTLQMTVQISASVVQEVESVSGGAPTSFTARWAVGGSAFRMVDSCPDARVTTGTFTASGTSVFLEFPTSNDAGVSGTLVEVFAKQ